MAQSLGVAWAWSLGGPDRAGIAPGLLQEALSAFPAWLGAVRAAPGQHHVAVDPAWLGALRRLAQGAQGVDPWVDLLERPPAGWREADRAFALASAPKPDAAPWPSPVAWLLERRAQREGRPLAAALGAFSPDEQANFVLWSALAALGPEAWADWPEAQRALARADGLDAADRAAFAAALRSRVGLQVQALRQAVGEGLLKPTWVPMAGACLPLLADLALGRPPGEAPLPELHAPPERLLAAWRLGGAEIAEALGASPDGAIPPGLASSLPVADAAAAAGAGWLLLDEGALAQAGADLGRSPEGVAWDARLLYGGMALDTPTGPLRLAFRDAVLSDRLAFHHARMAPEEAADDLAWRLHEARRLLPDGEAHVVPLALEALAFGRGRVDHGAGHLKACLQRLALEPALPPKALGDLPPQRRWAHLSPSGRSPLWSQAKGLRARRLWASAKGLRPSPFDEGAPAGALAATLSALALAGELQGEGLPSALLEGAAIAHLRHAAALLGAHPPTAPQAFRLPPPSPALPAPLGQPPTSAPRWRQATAPLVASASATGTGPLAQAATGGLNAAPKAASPAAAQGDGLPALGKPAGPSGTKPDAKEAPSAPLGPTLRLDQPAPSPPKASKDARPSFLKPEVAPPPTSPTPSAVAAWVDGEHLLLMAKALGPQATAAWVGLCYPGLPAATSPWPHPVPESPPTAAYRFTHAWELQASGACQLHRADGQGGWQALGPSGEVAWAEGALSARLPASELPLPEGAPIQLVLALVGPDEAGAPRVQGVAPPQEPLALKCPASVPLVGLA